MSEPIRCVLFVLLALTQFHAVINDGFTIKNYIHFPGEPGGAFIGIFLALALPLDLPRYNIFVSYNIEANYNLPSNETEFSYPPVVSKRSTDRARFYSVLESKIKSYGYPGRECLLRAICEASEYHFKEHGVIEDIAHILLSPSTSVKENLPEHRKAEAYGRNKGHCRKYLKSCNFNLLGLISRISLLE